MVDWDRFNDFHAMNFRPIEDLLFEKMADHTYLIVGYIWDSLKLSLESGYIDQDKFESKWIEQKNILIEMVSNANPL